MVNANVFVSCKHVLLEWVEDGDREDGSINRSKRTSLDVASESQVHGEIRD